MGGVQCEICHISIPLLWNHSQRHILTCIWLSFVNILFVPCKCDIIFTRYKKIITILFTPMKVATPRDSVQSNFPFLKPIFKYFPISLQRYNVWNITNTCSGGYYRTSGIIGRFYAILGTSIIGEHPYLLQVHGIKVTHVLYHLVAVDFEECHYMKNKKR